jgi:hypothetical protein
MKIMRPIFLSLFSLSFLFLSCEGPEGPPGVPGVNILGKVIEVSVDLDQGNGYQQVVTLPLDVEVFESDAILVYRHEGVFDTADIWTPLPTTYFNGSGGTFLYTFNHTYFDVKFFLDGNFDLNTLGSQWTQNQLFRIAIVPAEYGNADWSMEDIEQSGSFEFLGN